MSFTFPASAFALGWQVPLNVWNMPQIGISAAAGHASTKFRYTQYIHY